MQGLAVMPAALIGHEKLKNFRLRPGDRRPAASLGLQPDGAGSDGDNGHDHGQPKAVGWPRAWDGRVGLLLRPDAGELFGFHCL
jgi:hypothetical protein